MSISDIEEEMRRRGEDIPKESKKTPLDYAKSFGKGALKAGAGAARQIAGNAAGALDLASLPLTLPARALGYDTYNFSDLAKKGVDKLTGNIAKPTTDAEKNVEGVLDFVGPGFISKSALKLLDKGSKALRGTEGAKTLAGKAKKLAVKGYDVIAGPKAISNYLAKPTLGTLAAGATSEALKSDSPLTSLGGTTVAAMATDAAKVLFKKGKSAALKAHLKNPEVYNAVNKKLGEKYLAPFKEAQAKDTEKRTRVKEKMETRNAAKQAEHKSKVDEQRKRTNEIKEAERRKAHEESESLKQKEYESRVSKQNAAKEAYLFEKGDIGKELPVTEKIAKSEETKAAKSAQKQALRTKKANEKEVKQTYEDRKKLLKAIGHDANVDIDSILDTIGEELSTVSSEASAKRLWDSPRGKMFKAVLGEHASATPEQATKAFMEARSSIPLHEARSIKSMAKEPDLISSGDKAAQKHVAGILDRAEKDIIQQRAPDLAERLNKANAFHAEKINTDVPAINAAGDLKHKPVELMQTIASDAKKDASMLSALGTRDTALLTLKSLGKTNEQRAKAFLELPSKSQKVILSKLPDQERSEFKKLIKQFESKQRKVEENTLAQKFPEIDPYTPKEYQPKVTEESIPEPSKWTYKDKGVKSLHKTKISDLEPYKESLTDKQRAALEKTGMTEKPQQVLDSLNRAKNRELPILKSMARGYHSLFPNYSASKAPKVMTEIEKDALNPEKGALKTIRDNAAKRASRITKSAFHERDKSDDIELSPLEEEMRRRGMMD